MKKDRKFSFVRLAFLSVALLFALVLASCGGCGGGEGLEPGQVSVLINEEEIEIRAAFSEEALASAGKKVYLFELPAGVSAVDLTVMKPVGVADASGNVRFNLPVDHNGASRVYYGFFLAFYDESTNAYVPAIERPVYVENPEDIAYNPAGEDVVDSLKGLADPGTAAAVELGISHTLVELPIEKYILPGGNADAFCHVFGGESFFFDADAIAALDKKLEKYAVLGLNVFLRVYMGSAEHEIPQGLEYLGLDGETVGTGYYSVNFADERAMSAYAAFIDLLGSRYARIGIATGLIVGRGANSPSGQVGDKYIESYEHALRISHLIMRSHASCATVYAAVDSDLATRSTFLNRLAAIAIGGGNYDFGIAAELSAGSDRVWYGSPGATEQIPTNLNELTALSGSEGLLYGGESRRVIISDFAVPATGGEASLANQAASYAFSYYKVVENGTVSAFIYSSLYDGESGEGLMTAEGEKKNIFGIFAAVDTEKEIGVTVSQVITGTVWTDLYGNEELREKVIRGKSFTGSLKTDSEENYDCTPMFSIDGDSFKLFALTGDGYLGVSRAEGESYVYAAFEGGAAGVTFGPITADRLSGNYLIIPMRFDSAEESEFEFTLTLTQNDHAGEIRICAATGKLPVGENHTVVFDISSLTSGKLECDAVISLSVSGDAPFTVTLGEFLAGNVPPSVWLIILIVALCAVGAAGIAVLLVLWFRKAYGAKKAEGDEESSDGEKTEAGEKDKTVDEPDRGRAVTVRDMKNRQTASRTAQQTAQSTASRSAYHTASRPAQNTVRQVAMSNTASRPAQSAEKADGEDKNQN